MAEKNGNHAVICLSNEEEEEEYNEVDEETTSQSCSEEGGDWNHEESDLESFEDSDEDGDLKSTKVKLTEVVDSEDSCNRVIHHLRGGSDLKELKLVECKAYLRKQGLRLTGNKAVCIQRIKEHWRVNEGEGEKLYPRSSFFINCTGDACTGDVVLFTQKVHERNEKVTRGRNLLGKRTIAGRIVKESYGAAKQQHTFTVEVLWSNGFKRLPPMFPLLVKGRYLYKMKTFRQRWDNEEERSKILAEKHRRGAEARRVRAMKNTARPAKQGSKQRKQSHHARSPMRRRNQEFLASAEMERQKKQNQTKDNKAGAPSNAMTFAPFHDRTNQMPVVPTVSHAYQNSGFQIGVRHANCSVDQGGQRFQAYPDSGFQIGARHVNCSVDQGGSLHPNHRFQAYPDSGFQIGGRNVTSSVEQGGNFHPNYGFHAYQFNANFMPPGNWVWRPRR
ncbi:hypothetical protein NE237_024431 [Protea cynaroides]|uniref:SAP domain-containing protein n=1 Tax=Protea cynaroides TaxID=273540 RepID=A0A9Q0HDP7_9MAGN|nr:hypothetical protein NE237_024431 [Protea cynaroides]